MTNGEANELCNEYQEAFRCLRTKGGEPNRDSKKVMTLLRRVSQRVAEQIVSDIKRGDPNTPKAQWPKPKAATLTVRLAAELAKYTPPTCLANFKHGCFVYFVDAPHIKGVVDKESKESMVLVPQKNEFGPTYVRAIPADKLRAGMVELPPLEEYQAARDEFLSSQYSGYLGKWFCFLLNEQYWHEGTTNDTSGLRSDGSPESGLDDFGAQ